MSSTVIPEPAQGGAMPGQAPIHIHRMTLKDIRDALAAGWDDLQHSRTDALLMGGVFPVGGVIFAAAFVIQGFLPFVFPLLAGFALIGPLATLWFAALSRQRELGEESVSYVFAQPRMKQIQRLALIAILIYLAWNAVAGIIYYLTLGSSNADPNAEFFVRVFTTTAGWELIIIGCTVGAVFAVVTLAISAISFAVVIDRPVTAFQAIGISLQAMLQNPLFVLAWGAVVIAGLLIGGVTFLLGMVVVLPVLGHATWHIYRRMTA